MSSPSPKPPLLRRRRVQMTVLATLVPLVPLVVALFLGAGTHRATAAATPASRRASATPSLVATPAYAAVERAAAVPAGPGALVAYVPHATGLFRTPGARRFAVLQGHTGFHSPTFVLVDRVRGRWLGVTTTQAGNNRIAWIRASSARLSRNSWSLHAELTRHELLVSHDGRIVRRFPIAVGKPTAPTPTGHYAVTDRLSTGDPTGPYGCCILALSARAPHAISDWDGGYRIAIHSTPEAESIGESVSHGCMRLSLADGRWLLAHIPLGTPVAISSA